MKTLLLDGFRRPSASGCEAGAGSGGRAGGMSAVSEALLVRDGRIAWLGPAAEAPPAEARLDAGGRALIPGLIDVHVHGAGGGDVLDRSVESLELMASTLARLGTTSFLATAALLPGGGNGFIPVAVGQVGRRCRGAELLGLHLEGPFINPARRGGLPPESIRPPSPRAVQEVLDLTGGELRMMTMAPELDGGLAAVERVAERGVVASLGHSDAMYEETRAGIAAGIGHVTHLYNAMRGLHHREPGPLVAIHEAEHIAVQLICDGVHLSPAVVGWTRRIFGARRCVCVTDGINTMGLPDGTYQYAGKPVVSRGGQARRPDGRLVGTSLSLLEIVYRFSEYTGCSLAEAVDTASRIPAELLGIAHRKGAVAVGFDADLVLLDDDGAVWATIVGGEVVVRRGAAAGG